MNIAIVEDQPEDRLLLAQKIEDYMENRQLTFTLHEYPRAEDFVEALSSVSFGLVFMDIYLEEMSGMEAAEILRKKDKDCKLVFLTMTKDFALQGYSVNASHYLVKPVNDEMFLKAMENCQLRPPYGVPHLDISSAGGPSNLDTGRIMYINLQGRTVYIHTHQQVFTVNSSFSRVIEPLLSDNRFLLCIQGVLVNMDYISGHENSVFILKNGERVPMNLRNQKKILQIYRNYMFDTMGGFV